MKWWSNVIDWLTSNEGSRILTDAIFPFLAIVVAGVLAALIAKSMATRVLQLHENESKSAAVASLIAVARKGTIWHTLGSDERSHTEHLGDESSVRLRLLPVPGAGLAAAWAEHEIAVIKENAPTFSFQSEQSFNDLRDRLVEWQAKPARARKLFRADLDRWRVEDESTARRAVTEAEAAPQISAPQVSAPQVSAPQTTSPGAAPEADPSGANMPSAAPVVAPASWPAPVAPSALESSSELTGTVEPPRLEAALASPAAATPGNGEAAAAETAASEHQIGQREGTTGDESAEPASSAANGTPVRSSTGMVSTPVVQPPRAAAPASPSDAADRDSGDEGEREPAFSAPVSAHQVRRRTSPESDAS